LRNSESSAAKASLAVVSATQSTVPRSRLKADAFGSVTLVGEGSDRTIERDVMCARWWLRPVSRWVASREARALARLAPLEGFARVLRWDRRVLVRSYIDGAPMQEAQPQHVAFYREAWRLLRAMHRRGVSHNDLAKEPNWLVTPAGSPALTDFQMALFGPPRSRRMRLLAREDLRHLLKHKRTYCSGHLTPVERRVLARRSWFRALWFASVKPVYRFVTRRVFRWRDNEGKN